MKTHVLDASALMTFFEDRSGAAVVEDLLGKATDARRPLLMSVVNWGEVCYSVWRSRGEAAAEKTMREIAQLPLEIVDAGFELTRLAAGLKAEHHLPYTDCFAAALALSRHAPW